MRIYSSVCLLAASLLTGACQALSDGSPTTPTAPSGPPSAGSTVVYTVVGASDAIGYGSSKPCFAFEDCDGNGYAWVAARQLRSQGLLVEIGALGIPAAVLSPTFQLLAAQYSVNGVTYNLAQSEAPFVRRDSTVVTIFTGANDVNVITGAMANGAGIADPNGFIDQQVTSFATEFAGLIATIRGRAPGVKIIAMNLPNLARVPFRVNSPPLIKQWAQRASVGITTTAINTQPNIAVVDLMCDPRFYAPSTFSADGFHPNDSGYAIMAAEIVKAITSATYPAPQTSCSAMF